jgi:hypothetical protein
MSTVGGLEEIVQDVLDSYVFQDKWQE